MPWPTSRRTRRLALVVLLAVAAGAALTTREATRDRTLPAPGGPLAVGRRVLEWDGRRLWAWYPAAPVARPALRLGPLLRAHAVANAPVADARPAYPLLLFSPGLDQHPTGYNALAEELASHGYVVLGVPHPAGALAIAHRFRFDSAVGPVGADLAAVLDRVARVHARGDPFLARVDVGRVGVFGHSFGGAAAAEACRLDARFRAGADLDGTLFGGPVDEGVRQPFLLVFAPLWWGERFRRGPPRYYPHRDQARLHEERFVARSAAATWLVVPRLAHMGFTDEAFRFRPAGRLAELVGARLDGRRTRALASRHLRAFFGRHLGGA